MASTANFTENVAAITNSSFFIAKSGCQLKCGDITVPYPFGFGESRCYISSWFQLTCNYTFNPPKLFVGDGNIDVSSFSQTQVRVGNTVAVRCYDETGATIDELTEQGWMSLGEGLTFSDTANKFTVVGCNVYAWIQWSNDDGEFSTGCSTSPECSRNGSVLPGKCMGFGCCQIDIPKGFTNFNNTDSLNRIDNDTETEVWILFPFRYSDRNVAQ